MLRESTGEHPLQSLYAPSEDPSHLAVGRAVSGASGLGIVCARQKAPAIADEFRGMGESQVTP